MIDTYGVPKVVAPGVPVTSTDRSNSTSTSIASVRPYVLSLAGALDIATPVTPGATSFVPSTWYATASAKFHGAKVSRASVVVPVARIVAPPGSVKAFAPMLIPVESASAATTV